VSHFKENDPEETGEMAGIAFGLPLTRQAKGV